jgi:ketol-acid reductoisomerase
MSRAGGSTYIASPSSIPSGVRGLARVYSPGEIDTSILEGKVITSIGYGFQGRRYSMSIRAHGFRLIVGNIRGSYYDQAVADGMEVYTIEEAAERADIVMVLTGDEVQPRIYGESLRDRLGELWEKMGEAGAASKAT